MVVGDEPMAAGFFTFTILTNFAVWNMIIIVFL